MEAKEQNVDRVVHMSTSEVYGTAQQIPMDELHPQVAQSPYSASKIAADKIAQSFYRSFGTPIVIARPFNTYGPRQSNRAVIPSIILQALRDPNEIVLGSLTASRDFNYVGDTVNNLIKMALSKEGAGYEFNLCCGKDYKLTDIVNKVATYLGGAGKVGLDETRVRPKDSEVERLIGNPTAANCLFNLEPRTSIDIGLQSTIEYFQSHYTEEKFTL